MGYLMWEPGVQLQGYRVGEEQSETGDIAEATAAVAARQSREDWGQ